MKTKQPPEKIGPQQRSLVLRAAGVPLVDTETRTATFPFSSEEPCDMGWVTEILSHAPGAMRNGIRQGNLNLIFNHNRDDLLGKVESITVGADKRGYCTVRFGKDERGEWAMRQAADDILVNVSFMYRVFKYIEDTEEDTYTGIDWEVYEVSLVTVPADASVGMGRSADLSENAIEVIRTAPPGPPPDDTQINQPASAGFFSSGESRNQVSAPAESSLSQGEKTMKHRQYFEQAGEGIGAGAPTFDTAKLRAEAQTAERDRVNEIDAMCAAHKVPAEIRAALIQKGATVSEARGAVLDLQLKSNAQSPVASMGDGFAPDLSNKEKARYSMLRAVNAAMSRDWKNAGFELEVSNDIGKRMGKGTEGFFMPTNLEFAAHLNTQERAQYAAGAVGTGGAMVATNLLGGSFIEVLRNKARVLQLGATVLSGLVGNVDIPRQTGATATYWLGETTNITEGEATFDKVSLAFKSIGAYSAVTRQMLLQSTPDIEMLARADLIAQIALGIDLAALSGSGTSNQPTGIANTSGIGSVVGGTNGAQLSIDHLIALETAIASANADVDGMAYLANAKSVGWLKGLKSSTGQYLWTNLPGGQRSGTPGEINGYAVARSNQARSTLTKGTASGICSEVFMGNWAELLIGEWGVLEIVPNPYDATLFKQGGVLLRAMQSCDIAVRHAASFATISDALTA